MKLHNYMEIEVERQVKNLLAKSDMCKCEKCRLDIMSIALNQLPPHYVVTSKGALFAQMKEFSTQHNVDILTAVLGAMETVRKNPRH